MSCQEEHVHIKAVLLCIFKFKGAVDCTFMQLFNQMSTTVPRKKKFLGQLQVERFTNEYSDRHLKGILEEGAV